MDDFAKKFKSQSQAYSTLEKEAKKIVKNKNITGIFEEKVVIKGEIITVRGNVINGKVKIGTAFK